MLLLQILFSSLLTSLVSANLLTSPTQLSNSTQYDFVIVGAGPGGSVLASRLTENPDIKVLLIEAGGSNDGVLGTIVPFLGITLAGTAVDWNFTTVSQTGLDGRSIPYPRGQVLGGSGSINFMTWNRGSTDVWDNWAKLTGDPGWSFNSVQEFYLKTSRLVPPADGHDTTGQVNASAHGNGPVEISVPGFPTELDSRVIDSSKELGGRFPFNLDLNAGNGLGFSTLQSSIGGGSRSSPATAYLEPAVNRSNLDILIGTHVTRLIQSVNSNFESTSRTRQPLLKTVEMAQSQTSQRFKVTATKEVILSAGAIGTPQILLLSGIGPKAAIQSVGITPLVDLADVGQNLADHPLVPAYFSVNSNNTFDNVFRDPAVFDQDLQQWFSTRQGRFVDSPGNTQGFMRLPQNSSIFQTVKDPSSGPTSAHTEFIFGDGFAQLGSLAQPATGGFMTLVICLVSPTSRGSVTLASSDPFAKPVINPNMLSSQFDIFAMVQGMKDAQEFLQASPWNGFIAGIFGDLATATTDAAKANFARQVAVSISHPVGTARMSPAGASFGVVDSKGVVKGVSGLRIVDASIFPQIPECHPQAIVYTIAERIADVIKAEYDI